jgi:hypothetical protein
LAAAKSEIGTENLAVNVDRHCELNSAAMPCEPACRLRSPGAPRPAISHVTTAWRQSSGLQVSARGRLPESKAPSGIVAENSLLTVAGAAKALRVTARTMFLFDPLRDPPMLHDEITAKLCQAAIDVLSTKRLAVAAVSQKKKGLPASSKIPNIISRVVRCLSLRSGIMPNSRRASQTTAASSSVSTDHLAPPAAPAGLDVTCKYAPVAPPSRENK